MEQHVSWITQIANRYLGELALALLSVLHSHPDNPQLPIPEYVVMSLVTLIVGTGLALFVRSRLSVECPGATQQIAEILITNSQGFGIRDIVDESIPHHARRYLSMVGAVGLFVLLANLLSVFPALSAPTSKAAVPLACAAVVFVYFVAQGIRVQGPVGYVKHFAGDIWWLSPLIFPVEIISTSARLLSLTVRLWANILASDLIYVSFLGLFVGMTTWGFAKSHILGIIFGVLPATIPLLFIGLHIFVAFVQAYIFTILPAVYIGLATEHEL